MQLRIKLSDSTYNPVSGKSTVTIKTKRGIYTGVAKVHPDDEEVQSQYTGLRIAEMKAAKKAYKDELKREKIILHILPSIQKELIQTLNKCSTYQSFTWAQTLIEQRFYFIIKSHKKNINQLEMWIKSIDRSLKDNKKHLQQIKEKRRLNKRSNN